MNYRQFNHVADVSDFCPDAHVTAGGVKDVLAIIPARGGSKGIPRKNICDLGGKPLLAHSIDVARAACNIDRVIVSTDDEEIAAVARAHGAEVPFLRPAAIATDTADIMQSLIHVRLGLYERERYTPDVQVVFYPTHPFRKLSAVERMVELLKDDYATVTTFKEVTSEPLSCLSCDSGILNQMEDDGMSFPRQNYHRSYGYFLGRSLSRQAFRNYAHVLADEIEMIDIDEWEDLLLAREVISQNLYDFEL